MNTSTIQGLQRGSRKLQRKARHRVAKIQLDSYSYWSSGQAAVAMKPSQTMSSQPKKDCNVEEVVKTGISVGTSAKEFVVPSDPPKSFDTVRRGEMPAIIFRNGRVELQYHS